MSSTYRYQAPTPRKFNVLPEGDYMAIITEAEEAYINDKGNHVLKTKLAIQPSGNTVSYAAWSGNTSTRESRDNIGELLLAANRVPSNPQDEPNWKALVGAKIKVRLKVETDEKWGESNKVHYVYTPKKAEVLKPTEKSFSQSEFLKARGKQMEASGGVEPEPDQIPY